MSSASACAASASASLMWFFTAARSAPPVRRRESVTNHAPTASHSVTGHATAVAAPTTKQAARGIDRRISASATDDPCRQHPPADQYEPEHVLPVTHHCLRAPMESDLCAEKLRCRSAHSLRRKELVVFTDEHLARRGAPFCDFPIRQWCGSHDQGNHRRCVHVRPRQQHDVLGTGADCRHVGRTEQRVQPADATTAEPGPARRRTICEWPRDQPSIGRWLRFPFVHPQRYGNHHRNAMSLVVEAGKRDRRLAMVPPKCEPQWSPAVEAGKRLAEIIASDLRRCGRLRAVARQDVESGRSDRATRRKTPSDLRASAPRG